MYTQKDTRKKAADLAEFLKSSGQIANMPQYAPAWATMATAARLQKPIPDPKPIPTFRQMGIKGQCARAIQEAHDGEVAIKNKTERLGRILGVSYLMMTEAMQLIDESEHMMSRELRDELGLKVCLNKMNIAFDEYCARMKDHMSADAFVKFHDDLEAFDTNVRSFADIAGYRTETKEDRRKSFEERAINLHLDFIDKMLQIQEEFGSDAVKALMERIKKDEDIKRLSL